MQAHIGPDTIDPYGHVVHFYQHDDELVTSVTSYLAAAILAGGIAVVIATPDHFANFAAGIALEGVDVEAARATDALVVLDAADVMHAIFDGNVVDAAAFDAIVGRRMRRAYASGRRVSAFGEIVALLWNGGHVNAALEVETLWNGLRDELAFTLLCGYAADAVSGAHHHDAVSGVYQLHSSVVGSVNGRSAGSTAQPLTDVIRMFPKTLDAPAAARRFTVETVRAWGYDTVCDDAAIVVTELATNAVVHADSHFSVALTASDNTMRIAVTDDDPAAPAPRHAGTANGSGRGLAVIAAIAARWGSDHSSVGKVVWAEIALEPQRCVDRPGAAR